jgi:hypothetical protein
MVQISTVDSPTIADLLAVGDTESHPDTELTGVEVNATLRRT